MGRGGDGGGGRRGRPGRRFRRLGDHAAPGRAVAADHGERHIGRHLARQHTDGLGFTLPVPQDWTEYRNEPLEGLPTVNFISTDGTEGLAVAQAESKEKAQAVAGTVLGALMVPTNASPEAVQTALRVRRAHVVATIVPAAKGVWTVTLTVPRVAAGNTSANLFERIADDFTVQHLTTAGVPDR